MNLTENNQSNKILNQKYNEYFDYITEMFQNSIITKEKNLANKIYKQFISWYKTNYEYSVRNAFITDDTSKLNFVTNEIKKICKLSDLKKIEYTYIYENESEIINLYNMIFTIVKKISNNMITFSQEQCEKLKLKLDNNIKSVPEIIKNKYSHMYSEAILDLEYIKNKGNVKAYSFRTYNYLKVKNEIKNN